MITWIIIGMTVVVSWFAFRNQDLMEKLEFNAAKVVHQNQYYRLFSHAFVHVSWMHLLVNMLVLYFFGPVVESDFAFYFGKKSVAFFLLLYIGGILISNLYSLYRHKNNYYYNAVGASGAVSAVLFTFIFLNPWDKLYVFALVPIPGIIFAVIYLVYSWYMSKRGGDNIAHDAHFLGAAYGFFLPVMLKPGLFRQFLDQLFFLI